jgi:micrococcal nuclease
VLLLLLSCSPKLPAAVEAAPPSPVPASPYVLLDGEQTLVDWDDGDTFASQGGRKIRARMKGFNTLESYGPVHRWGDWTAEELYHLSKKAGEVASAEGWECSDTGEGGGYGRLLVDCPALRKKLLEEGLAHPFSIGGPAPEEDMASLRHAIAFKKGIWAKGAPRFLVTSLHSNDEDPEKEAYNRICDLSVGQCDVRTHEEVYAVCEEVCSDDSCMVYVPYSKRYKPESKADCLRISE